MFTSVTVTVHSCVRILPLQFMALLALHYKSEHCCYGYVAAVPVDYKVTLPS